MIISPAQQILATPPAGAVMSALAAKTKFAQQPDAKPKFNVRILAQVVMFAILQPEHVLQFAQPCNSAMDQVAFLNVII
jgi:hypothetical protein